MQFSHQALRAQRTVAKMIGRRFGFLTVESHHSRSRGYNCRCICGRGTVVRTWALKTGRIKSCGKGCWKRSLLADHQAAKNELYKRYRSAAKVRGYNFALTRSEFSELIVRDCHYCGAAPSSRTHLKRHEEFRYNGIDRVDNELGYTLANCVPCCDICNNSKSTLELGAWLSWIQRVHAFQKGARCREET